MPEPLWLSVARVTLHLHEIAGPQSSLVIMQWVKDIGAPSWYDNDDKPWCAVWMNRILLGAQMPMSGTGFELIRAASFSTWGVALPAPAFGCLVVFKRPEGYHVGIYVGESADGRLRILGGNQGNRVSLAWFDRDRVIAGGYRWPAGVALPARTRVLLKDTGEPSSVNES